MTKNTLRRLAGITAFALLVGACAVRQQPSPEALMDFNSVDSHASQPLAPVPPVAAKKPYQVPSPNGAREDDYYWLRDDSRQSPEMLDYLKKENLYRSSPA
jgi:oligopeptidase B